MNMFRFLIGNKQKVLKSTPHKKRNKYCTYLNFITWELGRLGEVGKSQSVISRYYLRTFFYLVSFFTNYQNNILRSKKIKINLSWRRHKPFDEVWYSTAGEVGIVPELLEQVDGRRYDVTLMWSETERLFELIIRESCESAFHRSNETNG